MRDRPFGNVNPQITDGLSSWNVILPGLLVNLPMSPACPPRDYAARATCAEVPGEVTKEIIRLLSVSEVAALIRGSPDRL